MALDAVRNNAYAAALKHVVTPDSVVLDLGAGTGVLGLMAARLGAKRVYLVEPEDVITVAGELAAANGLQGVVRCMQGRVEDLRLPERVDVVVSVLTGNFLVTEDLLPALLHARDTLLKPDGVLIPSAAVMEVVPISAPELHDECVARWSVPQAGIDLSQARTYAANTVFYRSEELRCARWLAEPRPLHTMNFNQDAYVGVQSRVTFEMDDAAECHGWAGWFRMQLGDQWLSTSPRHAQVHWSSAFLPLDPPMAVARGERVSLAVTRAPFGDWTWTVESASGVRRHSTLLAAPLNAAVLRRAALDYLPSLNGDGHAVLDTLSRCDRSTSVARLAQLLFEQYPDRYRDQAEALRLVQRVVKKYA
jgi:2-polyprenyl-3-methyl-5-hydroxy-6-metoxy-1,4-benzoquinol methylase